MQKWTKTVFSASLFALAAASGGAMAQQAPAGNAQAPMTAPNSGSSYSDAELEKFVGASQKVSMISQQYRPKLDAAGDEATRSKVFQQADQEMVKAVHAQGMTVDQFNGINQALQQDPALVERVEKMVK